MADGEIPRLRLELAHVLFLDIVGYSKLRTTEQSARIQQLREIVRSTEQFRTAETEGKLLRLPTGDGGALVFRSLEAPVLCAVEIAKALRNHPELPVRMGIHSGPVNEVTDLNEQANIAGAGINIAQRVMDCGDAGHILVSKHAAEDLEQHDEWQPYLHDLGQCEIKHGERLHVVNFYNDDVGNPASPGKFTAAKRTRPAPASRRNYSIAAIVIAAFLLIGATALFVIKRNGGVPLRTIVATVSTVPIAEKSIAVLPFENLSADKDNAFFASGIQDMILTKLAGIKDLKVISRTSTEKYASRPENLKDIGQQLGVAKILEGSVQKANNSVLINVQMIDATTDAHLWAQAYTRTLENIFGVEGEVAENIAESLHAALSGNERAALAQTPTRNAAALEAYLKGLSNPDSFINSPAAAVANFREAVTLDPSFILAWTELASAHLNMYWFAFDASPSRLAAAKAALDRAEALAPDLPEVEMARAEYLYHGLYDFTGALTVIREVQVKLPNNARLWFVTALLERRVGQDNAALQHLARARELDPNNLGIMTIEDLSLVFLGRYERARASIDQDLVRASEKALLLEIKLILEWNVGGLDAAEQMVAPLKTQTADMVALHAWQALYSRNFKKASELFGQAIAQPGDYHSQLVFDGYLPAKIGWLLQQALSETRAGSPAKANDLYSEVQALARAGLAANSGSRNVDAAWHATLGMANAGVGRAEEAVAEGKAATALVPSAVDQCEGPDWEACLAQIYAMNGDADHALPNLERLMQNPSYVWFRALLKFDPVWDPIRRDARFQALLAKNPIGQKKTTSPVN